MINISRTLKVNNGTSSIDLDRDQLWEALVRKAENPLPFVHSITACEIVERQPEGLTRDIIHVGDKIREVVTFFPKQMVSYERVTGRVRGTIENIIGDEDDDLTLTFHFVLTIEDIENDSEEERAFAEVMEADYLSAVETSLEAARQLASGEADRRMSSVQSVTINASQSEVAP